MKICSFCNTENKDDAVKCSSCGANSFKYKCENCGTMFENGTHCPHCGVKAGQEARKCPVCNTEYYTNACPTCGYVPVKATNSAAAPANNAPQPPAAPKRKTWLWVLGWIFIFPLPLTLILLKKQNMSKGLKYGIIAAAWILYVIIAFGGAASNNNKSVPVDQTAKQETTAATEKATSATTESKPADKSYYTIGESCTLNNITATVTGCEVFNYENRFVEKKDGYIYIKVNVKLENNSEKDQSLGSANFECYADNQSIDDSVLVSQDDYLKAFDKISPGRYISGAIYYEIPQGSDVELEFSSDWVAKKNKAIFKLDY